MANGLSPGSSVTGVSLGVVNGWSSWVVNEVLRVNGWILGESLSGVLGGQWLEPWVANGLSYSLVLLIRTR